MIMRLLLTILITINTCFATEIIIISDLNGSYGSTKYSSSVNNAIEQITKLKPDLVLSTGDMVAGQKHGLNYKEMWKSFHKNVTTPLKQSSIPFLVTPGNHDGSGSYRFKKERAEFISQWEAHKPEVSFLDDSNYPVYYSFVLDDILFISLDATLVGKLSLNQKTWLKNTLEKNSQYKTKIAYGHIPLVPIAQNRESDYLNDKEFEELLKKHKLTMYLSGHHHTYYPGYKDGMYHISQACLGSGARRLIGTSTRSQKSFTHISIVNNQITISAIQADTGKIINKSTLPKQINTSKGLIVREDLAKKP